MSDLDPKTPTEKKDPTPGVTTAPNIAKKLTVYYDEMKDKFTYSPDPNGDLNITRYKGEDESFPVHFERGKNEDWKFKTWTWAGVGSAPVITGAGKPVLELDDLQDALVKVMDRIDLADQQSATYKYSFSIQLADSTTKEVDPEIQNNREVNVSRP